ncbi:MAG: hypothetical protein EOM44_04115 [Bacteroidia bacterium]|nr:hypothetical protein [Bacteroidia bacterium]
MPVSFRGLSKGSVIGGCKVLAKNTLARRERGRFFRQTTGSTLQSVETRFTFARRTKQYAAFWKKAGKNNNEVRTKT